MFFSNLYGFSESGAMVGPMMKDSKGGPSNNYLGGPTNTQSLAKMGIG